MIDIILMYPAGEGSTFDMNYYLNTHIPLFKKRMGTSAQNLKVLRGVQGLMPGSPAPYVAIAHWTAESAEAYAAAFAPHAEEILGDIPKYTNIQPVVQYSEIIPV
jgi:uncharacterized protein (TIGR02118 family)